MYEVSLLNIYAKRRRNEEEDRFYRLVASKNFAVTKSGLKKNEKSYSDEELL